MKKPQKYKGLSRMGAYNLDALLCQKVLDAISVVQDNIKVNPENYTIRQKLLTFINASSGKTHKKIAFTALELAYIASTLNEYANRNSMKDLIRIDLYHEHQEFNRLIS
jgi:hypothetical protein